MDPFSDGWMRAAYARTSPNKQDVAGYVDGDFVLTSEPANAVAVRELKRLLDVDARARYLDLDDC
jgi:hypothetical protein